MALVFGRACADFAPWMALNAEVVVVTSHAFEERLAAVRDADTYNGLRVRLELQFVGVVATCALVLIRAAAGVTERVARSTHVRLGQQSAVERVESVSRAGLRTLGCSRLQVVLVKVVLRIDVALRALVDVRAVTSHASWAAAEALVVRLVEERQAGQNAGSSGQSVVSCRVGCYYYFN